MEVTPWERGEKLKHGHFGHEQFVISSIRTSTPDPTSVLSTVGHRQCSAHTTLSSDRWGHPSTAQLGIATQPSKATSGQLQGPTTIFPRAVPALDGPEQPQLGPTPHPWAQEVV